MIDIVNEVVQRARVSHQAACRELGIGYSSLMRWRRHRQKGEPVVGKPGPAKTEPLNQTTLNAALRKLQHGRERTRGTGALYDQRRKQISRRDLQALVAATRREVRREKDALERRIEWLRPGLVWSMDDAQLERLRDGHAHAHVVHDLGSRYTLKSLGSRELADGPTVARNLEELFMNYGAPLFLKRDNGSNLNHSEVTALLENRWIIPLNSPCYYPPYNGAIEKKQQELQRRLQGRLGLDRVPDREYELELELSGYELNHKQRGSLGGVTACRSLEDARLTGRRFGRRERKEVFEQITALTVDIMSQLEDDSSTASETAFRYAAETWMQQNHIINVTQNGKVLPCFYQFQSH